MKGSSTDSAMRGDEGRSKRSELIDAIRGLSLLGVLIVNFPGVGQTGSVDAVVAAAIDETIYRTFYSLFILLFGVGTAMQFSQWQDSNKSARRYLRRLSGLLGIGVMHTVLIWAGDILVAYAILGLLLLPFRKVSNGVLGFVAIALGALLVLQPRIAERVDLALPRAVSIAAPPSMDVPVERDYWQDVGTRSELLVSRLKGIGDLRFMLGVDGGVFGGAEYYSLLGRDLLFLMFLGMWIGRKGWLTSGRVPAKTWYIVGLCACGAYLAALALRDTGLAGQTEFDRMVYMLGKYSVTLGVVAIMAIICARGWWERGRNGLTAVGQTALSTYIMQSLVMTWLFLPYGIGLPLLPETSKLIVNVVFFCYVQVPCSRMMLYRFGTGPLEWLWRSWTEGRLLSFRTVDGGRRAAGVEGSVLG